MAEEVTRLPDGSAFMIGSFPLPKDHWFNRANEDGSYEEPPASHFERTPENVKAIRDGVRWAIRAATDCGRIGDYDPDALVLNAIYALCGPRELTNLAESSDHAR